MRLAINIDHIATLRNARGGKDPNPVEAARICEEGGAQGIVCHLREDRRHIRDDDVRALRKSVATRLDLEMAATEEIVRVALEIVPDFVTLVPERRQELTTEDGLNVVAEKERLAHVIGAFHGKGIRVSLFVNPVQSQIETSRGVGADMVEIHTGEYAEARSHQEQLELLSRIRRAAELAKSIGMGVNAGHGLNYANVGSIANIPEIDELSIGYAIIVRSMYVGLEAAVKEMYALVRPGIA